MKNFIFSILTLLLFYSESFARAEAILVVASSPGSLTIEELRRIYFQNGGRLSSGQTVIPIDYREDNPQRDQFYQRAFGRSRVQMKAYWAQRTFTGKGNPPKSVDSVKETLDLVSKKSDFYIGYVSESEADGKLPVLLRLP